MTPVLEFSKEVSLGTIGRAAKCGVVSRQALVDSRFPTVIWHLSVVHRAEARTPGGAGAAPASFCCMLAVS